MRHNASPSVRIASSPIRPHAIMSRLVTSSFRIKTPPKSAASASNNLFDLSSNAVIPSVIRKRSQDRYRICEHDESSNASPITPRASLLKRFRSIVSSVSVPFRSRASASASAPLRVVPISLRLSNITSSSSRSLWSRRNVVIVEFVSSMAATATNPSV